MAGVVVIFDFDQTIIDCECDDWVVEEMGATQLFNQLLPTMPWNSLMDRIMAEFHSQGKTTEEIAECLKRIPLHPQIITAIKSAHAHGCDLRILSDANVFYIETIFKHHGLMEYFSEIHTNLSFVDEEGKLKIFPHHDFTSSPHGCSLCPPNMCKSIVMKQMQSSASVEGRRFIYIGDGSGDFCPSLKLGERDQVMPRKNFPLWELICKNSMLIKASVHEWSDGEGLERVLLHLINTISIEENNSSNYPQLISVDCKFGTIPNSIRENTFLITSQFPTAAKD
ncbi:hypothetical protein HHK36_001015 [Tetracentron sinense]|uniref:Uncharacterized protein n=1 Tax=Tetracentron sinense TaxID=13715 RepID=A0A835DR82_TETSI|nr:hypothetical protein HHK36_001015 [Tetracentron sinense]